jgi:regulator of RNase E activity RraA
MPLTAEQLTALGRLDTPAIADAIETFHVRLRNVGFADGSLACRFEDLPPIVGYAVTARIRTGPPPMVGAAYADRLDWWTSIRNSPQPSIVVLEDADTRPGVGALVGDVQAYILQALGVVGVITNGAVRSLPSLKALALQCFAPHVVPSHAYAHVFEFDVPVTVGSLPIAPGDLLHADRSGIVKVPPEIAADLPAAAATLRAHRDVMLAHCCGERFSLEGLRDLFASRDAAQVRPAEDSSR